MLLLQPLYYDTLTITLHNTAVYQYHNIAIYCDILLDDTVDYTVVIGTFYCDVLQFVSVDFIRLCV